MNIQWMLNRLKREKEKIAIIDKDQNIGYYDLIERYLKWKCFIKSNHIDKGEIIAIDGIFSADYFSLLLALIENENIVLPLVQGDIKQREEYLDISEADRLINLAGTSQTIFRKNSTLNPLVSQLRVKNRPGLIIFSSGSTGKPKGMLHNFEIFLKKYQEEKKATVTLLFMLLDHIGGMSTIFFTLLNGGTLVVTQSKQAKDICFLIENNKIEHLPTTPSFLNILLLSEHDKTYDLSSLKLISYGTEVMQEYVLQQLNQRFPYVKLRQTYGLSELGVLKVKSESSQSIWIKMEQDQYEFKIIDNILYIKSDLAMMGYLNADKPFTEDDWFNTHDRVIVKGDHFRILGRDSEIINIGGEKIFPAEIEDLIIQMSDVKDIVVKGEENPIFGNIVTAKVNSNKTIDPLLLKRKIIDFCSGRIGKQFIPAKVEIVKHELFNPRYKKVRN